MAADAAPDTLPNTMPVVELTAPGGPDNLVPGERPVPAPKLGEILIKVMAAGVNRPDVLQRQGHYNPPADASDLLGLEAAGTVAAIGEGVTRYELGDRVTALCHGGGYAGYVAVDARHALPVPEDMSWEHAAAWPETMFTVWANLFIDAGLQPGEVALIHGGSSGIGTTAIQMAREVGARTIVTVGTDEKATLCTGLGAAHAINYKTQDFVDEVMAVTDQQGVDVVLDMVGGDYLPRNLKCLKPGGRHVSIASLRGAQAEVNILSIMAKRLRLTGSMLRPRSAEEKGAIAAELLQAMWLNVALGRLEPVIFQTFPLAEAAKAHALMETGDFHGKLMLTVDHGDGV
ncbi:MAG: NAD(P)H-quinone oxidoreductase [Alphaproteobacteria bacterium]|nr:NAD(P)H-quinone oxidoreductase [Alphaproteobacteria bacterium SS10]